MIESRPQRHSPGLLACAALCLALAPALSGCDSGTPTIPDIPYPEHDWIEVTRVATGVRGVVLAMDGDLRIDQEGRGEIRIFGDRGLLPAVITEVRGGILEIRLEPGFLPHPNRPTEFELSVSELESVELAAYGYVSAPGLEVDRLALRMTGNGELDLPDLDAEELELFTARGTGEVRISGRVDYQRLELTGVADYEARDLASADTEVSLSGSGSATVRVAELLTASVAGSGSVYYLGDPAVDSTITGTGQVVRLGS